MLKYKDISFLGNSEQKLQNDTHATLQRLGVIPAAMTSAWESFYGGFSKTSLTEG